MDGRIVVEMHGTRAGLEVDEIEAELNDVLGIDVRAVDTTQFFHIAHYQLSPREPLMRLLAPSDDQPLENEMQLEAIL
jgi:hypothetical protein